MNIVLLGKPGAGKGYVSKYLQEKYGFTHISTGDLCRKNIKEKTEVGLLLEDYCQKGLLAPIDLILKMLKEEVLSHKNENIIFDGFPRTIEQAKELESITDVNLVLFVDVADATILERISKRRVCPKCNKMFSIDDAKDEKCTNCGANLIVRADDNLDVAKNRLLIYEKETKPLVDYYKAKIVVVDNSGSVDNTHKILDNIASKFLK